MNNKKIVIIRNRGQLTIPDGIRNTIEWAETNSVVQIELETSTKIVIQPHNAEPKIDWDELNKKLKTARAIKVKMIDTSTFIAEARNSK